VLRVNSADELPNDLVGIVGVTAGASAPEELVEAVINRLHPRNGVEEVTVSDEDEYFPPPRNIRELQQAIDLACQVMLVAPTDVPRVDDRYIAASEVLSSLQN
jgi:4-hydroxy-3-methylbut-2-enyl diphosphate reductase